MLRAEDKGKGKGYIQQHMKIVHSVLNSFGDICQHRNYFPISFSGEGQAPSPASIFSIFFICCYYYYYKVVQMSRAITLVQRRGILQNAERRMWKG